MDRMLKELAEYFQHNDGFAVVAHTSPDRDTLGSSLALFHSLRLMGKQAAVICSDPVPKVYHFLAGAGEIFTPEQAPHFSNIVAVDCADRKRMGRAMCLLDKAGYSINIDHHLTNDSYADKNLVDATAAATGEIMFRLLSLLEPGINQQIAACLYTAIITDTGNFSYSNTTENTFRTAAELLRCGVDVAQINTRVFRTVSYVKTKLMGLAIERMELLCGGRLGLCGLSNQQMQKLGATGEDTEGIIDVIRDVETVELAVLIRETEDGLCRVSLRSKSSCDVSVLAAGFGGGGHEQAAGMSIPGGLEQAREKVLQRAVALLEGSVWKAL